MTTRNEDPFERTVKFYVGDNVFMVYYSLLKHVFVPTNEIIVEDMDLDCYTPYLNDRYSKEVLDKISMSFKHVEATYKALSELNDTYLLGLKGDQTDQ
jgi:hypothetical protein